MEQKGFGFGRTQINKTNTRVQVVVVRLVVDNDHAVAVFRS
jgi:hypothetical protein